MNRRSFLTVLASLPLARRRRAADLPVRGDDPPLPEWDYTAEDYDAFLSRTTHRAPRTRDDAPSGRDHRRHR